MPKPRRILSTLCSKRLQPSDFIDISGLSRSSLTLSCGTASLGYPKIKSNVGTANRFPPNTRGFLYFHTPPKAPPLVGEIRFRCASNLDGFHNGKDLLLKDKFTPWSIPLYALANRDSCAKWREQLILDNLVTQAMLDKWATARNINQWLGPDRPVLYYITQPFVLHFNHESLAFYTATKDEISRCHSCNPVKDQRHRRVFPYGGTGLVRLEPLVYPHRPEQHRMTLRVLKIIEPVKALVDDYDGYLHQPTEGALIQRSSVRHPVAALSLNLSLKGAKILPLNFDDLP